MLKIIKDGMVLFAIALLILMLTSCGTMKEPAGSGSAAAQTPAANEGSPKAAEAVELTISAAASLTDALKEIENMYESGNKNMKLHFNYGASGALQQQIEQGAPVDLFLSAAAKNMKELVDRGLVDASKQKNLLTNDLVAVVPAEGKVAVGSISDLTRADVKRVAIGIPESVPAGNYAKEALVNAKLWDALQSKVVQAKDVRQVLQYVETGNTEAGFVYRTDALTSQKSKIAFAVDPKSYTPIEYPIGIVKSTKHSKEAEQLYAYLQSKEAMNVFAKYGFSVPK